MYSGAPHLLCLPRTTQQREKKITSYQGSRTCGIDPVHETMTLSGFESITVQVQVEKSTVQVLHEVLMLERFPPSSLYPKTYPRSLPRARERAVTM